MIAKPEGIGIRGLVIFGMKATVYYDILDKNKTPIPELNSGDKDERCFEFAIDGMPEIVKEYLNLVEAINNRMQFEGGAALPEATSKRKPGRPRKMKGVTIDEPLPQDPGISATG